jgi:integrase/recombinase XerD
VPDAPAPESRNALAVRESRELSGPRPDPRSVRSGRGPTAKRWQPPEGLAPEDVRAVVEAAATERDRLLLRVLWATGARISEALALRPADVHPDSLVLPNLKNPNRPTKRVFLPAGQADLPGALLFWARQRGLPDHAPRFVSRKRAPAGGRRPISRQQAWELVKAASERAGVRVLALQPGIPAEGVPAPVHPHLLRRARVRQLVRATKSLPIAQKQAGWARLQLAYLSVGDDEVREAMRAVSE